MKKKTMITCIISITIFFISVLFITNNKNYKNCQVSSASVLHDTAYSHLFIIDPGHGGVDGGALSNDGAPEKDINLDISISLSSYLELLNIPNQMTREGDRSIHDATAKTIRQQKISDIHNRLNLLHQYENSILISIHQNHYSVEKYRGTQVFYSKNIKDSKYLADSIQKSVVNKLQKDNKRQTKPSGTEIYLLYHAQRPAVMVECGFMSNDQEAQKLQDKTYQKMMAISIASGIIDYFTEE